MEFNQNTPLTSEMTGLKSAAEITADTFDGDPLTRPERDISLGGGTLRSSTIEAFDGLVDNSRVAAAFDGQITEEDHAHREQEALDRLQGMSLTPPAPMDEAQDAKKQNSMLSPWSVPKPSPFSR